MNEMPNNARKPWLAAVLSLFCTGLGQIYCGRVSTGLVLFLASLLFAPLVVLAAFLEPSTALLVALLVGLLCVLGLYVFATVDAYRLARRLGADYEPRDFNRDLIYALFMLVGVTYPAGVLLALRANAFEAFLVASGSEVPNLLKGDRVLANKVILRCKDLERGDVVIFRAPRDRHYQFIKRVIALPGDTVEVRAGRVRVNGKPLELDPLPRDGLAPIHPADEGPVYSETNAGRRYHVLLASAARSIEDYPQQKVPDDTCFVLGDNRNRSRDSRQFGFVPLGDLIGLVQYIYCPAAGWSRFGAFRD